MVRLKQGLLVRLVPHHEVQGSRTLMKEDIVILYIIQLAPNISVLMENHTTAVPLKFKLILSCKCSALFNLIYDSVIIMLI